eukprot:TRINITY_DN42924_c0_g1_i1.p1 TRINITY_DN42924_c0_g1~~TRINITY_DN42924_c0_g1_i1.p1  ORF type:complete len:229 (-),score=29.88 TRINITY_DN42924_c0_g1_i1:111-797(-)
MPLKVYTMPISQPARALSWACTFEGTEVEEVQIMPGKDTRTAEYRQQNPIASLPRLDDEGFILNESHAIMSYLGDKFHWKLYPADARVRARIHEYMNWHHQNTRRITLALFAPVMRPDIVIPPDVLRMWKGEVKGVLQTIERWLTDNPWLCGPSPTVADLSCYCEVGQCLDKFTGLFSLNGFDMAKFPKITAWLLECEKLPGFEHSHAALKQLGPKVRVKAEKLLAKL